MLLPRVRVPLVLEDVRAFQPLQCFLGLVVAEKADELSRRFHFYLWRDATRPGWTQVRWVTSWDTTESDVDELLGEL